MYKLRSTLETLIPYTSETNPFPVTLNANEYPTDLPKEVKDVIIKKLTELNFNRYPLSDSSLRSKIAKEYGLQTENVFLGNGSSQILAALCYAFSDESSSIVYPTPSFSMYNIYAKLADRNGVGVELEEDFKFNPDKFLDVSKKENASLIILCNPNNPTGQVISNTDVEYIAKNSACPVILDEAYMEFYDESAIYLMSKYPNLAITRTFSKAYSLASARIGYILAAKEIITTLSKVLPPYNMNSLSLISAEVVWDMKDMFKERIAGIIAERGRVEKELEKINNFKIYPSQSNFILFKTKDRETTKLIFNKLKEKGIIVRDFSSHPLLNTCLRVTLGTKEENDLFITEISSF
ncbi:histidinol-phosphate transaminase [Selenomonadales bacterium OttesenSCG-928-I06]|nr:histidinol-phosphate transaminase [Selenomonadales bacterium OttesenSCG-928-I06]